MKKFLIDFFITFIIIFITRGISNTYISGGIAGILSFWISLYIDDLYKKLKEEISDADKMFKKLEYKKIQNEEMIWYQKKTNFISKDIIFDLEKKIIHIEISYYDKKGNLLKIEGTLTLEELQAINKKVEELKWMK